MVRPRREGNASIVDWVRSFYGPGRQYASARSLSLAARHNENAVKRLEENGYATPEVLVDIARAAGVSPVDPLLIVGLLEEEEVTTELSGREPELVRLFRRMTVFQQFALLQVAEGFLQPATEPLVMSREVETPDHAQ